MSGKPFSRIPGFYRLGIAGRRKQIAQMRGLDEGCFATLDNGGIDLAIADGMIENVVGTFALPLGLGMNFRVDGRDYIVPMAIEESSVVAAASNAARMVRIGGGFHTTVSKPVMIGQIQLLDVADVVAATAAIEANRESLLAQARALTPRLLARGGGPVGLTVRTLSTPTMPDGGMLAVHILVDCRDAMGANLVNSLAEALADDLARIAGARPGLKILSNLADERMVAVTAKIPDDVLDLEAGGQIRRAIVAASRFAELDPYRAATHNKGIMNGVDAVLMATGNDWRSAEAGAHAFAARSGRYQPLAVWTSDGGILTGCLSMPLAVGTVGGALHVHEGAKLGLRILNIDCAQTLASVVASVGLASNFAALRALATDGIQRGHLSLHARMVARAVGAKGKLVELVAAEISSLGDVKQERAREILERLRQDPVNQQPAEDML